MSQGNSTTYNHILTQAQLDELQIAHHEQVMKHNSNQVTTSAAQSYANTINGNNVRRTFATQSHSYTNPNTLNLQRWGYTATNNGGQLICGNNTNNYEEDIQTNADNIAQNTIDIATNTTNIEENTNKFNLYAPIESPQLTGNVTLTSTNPVSVDIINDNGSSTGQANLYLGQSMSVGGGIRYDGTSGNDIFELYTRDTNGDNVFLSNSYHNNDVTMYGNLKIQSDILTSVNVDIINNIVGAEGIANLFLGQEAYTGGGIRYNGVNDNIEFYNRDSNVDNVVLYYSYNNSTNLHINGDLIFPDGTTQTTAYTGPTPAPIAGLGANYKMPFHVFGSSDGAVKSFPLNVFQMELTPNGWSRFDKIYLKVNMRHMTTFNDNVSPNTVIKTSRGYFDGVWILSPSNLRNPEVASSNPVFDSPDNGTGNPISGGVGYGDGAIDTSNVYNSDYFYREMGSIVDGDWGLENNINNKIVSFYLYISGDSTAQFIWRYLYNDIRPGTTRNQDMSGTIEILSAVNSNTVGGTGGNLTLKAYNINGGYTFNDTHSIITI
jgi:hypothetical protein